MVSICVTVKLSGGLDCAYSKITMVKAEQIGEYDQSKSTACKLPTFWFTAPHNLKCIVWVGRYFVFVGLN